MPALWRSGAVLVAIASAGCRYGFDLVGDGGPGGGDGGGDRDGADPTGDGGDPTIDANVDAPGGSSVLTFVGPGQSVDTSVNSAATALNYGGGVTFNVRSDAISTFTGLVRFDVSSIAPAASIVSAELRITTTTTVLASGQVSFYAMLESWTEGTGVGAVGTANWNERLAGTAWTTAGVGNGSRAANAFAGVQPTQGNMTYTIVVPPGLVEQWVDAPAMNFGVALVASGTGMGDSVAFVSSEGTAGMQPTLAVTTGP